MTKTMSMSEYAEQVGQELGPSSWFEITQQRVNQFADATNDHQFIHVDPVKAAQTPFGGPVAHGFLTLSLVPALLAENAAEIEGLVMAVNYGSDRVRFLQPVPVGSRIRARQKLLEVTEKIPGRWLNRSLVTVDIEGQENPALVAEFLAMMMIHSS